MTRSKSPQDDDTNNAFDDPPTMDAVQALEVQPRDKAYLIFVAGPTVGETFELQQKVTIIGRGHRADVQVTDAGVSRRHAELRFTDDGKILIRDLDSRNGTFLNGTQITERLLNDGDKIQVGSTTILKFSLQDWVDEGFQRQMFEAALRDGLTKVFNRRYLIDRLHSEVAYALRHQAPLAVIMFDVDRFKEVNDQHGHLAGDFVLATMAQMILGTIRREDVFARYGGEEFVVICRGIDLHRARSFGERIRHRIEKQPFFFEGTSIPVTVSVGVAMMPPGLADPEQLIKLADQALYQAKDSGRNCVKVAESNEKGGSKDKG